MRNKTLLMTAFANIGHFAQSSNRMVVVEDDELMIPFERTPPTRSLDPYMEETRGAKIDIAGINVTHGRDILVHNKQHLHTFTVHGVEIQAPNLKAAKKIYNRTKRK